MTYFVNIYVHVMLIVNLLIILNPFFSHIGFIIVFVYEIYDSPLQR